MPSLITVEDLEFIRCNRDSILVRNDKREIWLPESLIEYDGQDDPAIEEGTMLSIDMPEWLAIDRGLI